MDDTWSVMLEGFRNLAPNVVSRRNRHHMRAERMSPRREVGIFELSPRYATRIMPLLMAADRPVGSIVREHDFRLRSILECSRELLAGHEYSTVTDEGDRH